jgi:hypothetical protein
VRSAPLRFRPKRAVDLARSAVGIVLDYTPDTLPVLDHYLRGVPRCDEIIALVAAAAGANPARLRAAPSPASGSRATPTRPRGRWS